MHIFLIMNFSSEKMFKFVVLASIVCVFSHLLESSVLHSSTRVRPSKVALPFAELQGVHARKLTAAASRAEPGLAEQRSSKRHKASQDVEHTCGEQKKDNKQKKAEAVNSDTAIGESQMMIGILNFFLSLESMFFLPLSNYYQN